MPLTCAQICELARQTARAPGFTVQSGRLLNMILGDLAQNYDFDLARATYDFNFNPSQINNKGQAYQIFPADFLRAIRNECFYYISGVPYPMIPLDLSEFDMLVQQAGVNGFPVYFTVSVSGDPNLPGNQNIAYFWPVPSGSFAARLRYYAQPSDITSAENSSAIPWFPNQDYLLTRLAGELMKLTDDERKDAFLGHDAELTPNGAGVLLKQYLKMKDNKGDRAQVVTLDRRRFGSHFDTLRNTKQIGW